MTTTRRILRIIARLNTGGPAIHTVLLTAGLQEGRWQSRLVTGLVDPGEGDMGYFAESHHVVPIIVPALGRSVKLSSDLRAFVALFRLMWRERPDIVHTHTTKAGAFGRAAGLLYNLLAPLGRRRRARLVHTFHGHLFHGYFSAPVTQVLIWGERILALFSHRIITVSGAVRDELVHRYRICAADKVSVVSLGFDFGWTARIDEWTGSLRREFAVRRSAVVVGIVGRLTEIKNHTLLFSAISRMKRDNIVTLVLGDGELRGDLEAAVRMRDLDREVVFTGWQRDQARMFADLDIVCLTSRNEGTPVALIEAMAAGRPFVATNVGGVVDLMVGEPVAHSAGFGVYANGILVPPEAPDVLAAALTHLIDRADLRRAMGAVGQAAVLKRFGKERLLEEMEAIYCRLLEDDEVNGCAR
jgi:glycosyltransferase involved in cell wall biosynthesis